MFPALRAWLHLTAGGAVLSLVLLGCAGPRPGSPSSEAVVTPADQPAATAPRAAPALVAVADAAPAAQHQTPSSAPRAPRVPLPVSILPDAASDRAARAQRSRAQVAAAAKAGGPERFLTPLASIPAFDPSAYAADPEGYVSEAVPARALRDAGSLADAPALELAGPGLRSVASGQAMTILVLARPGAPVSFYCGDLAQADNGLGAISVQAGADGWASAIYTPEPGATDDAHISIASPVCTGVLRVTVTIARSTSSKAQ